MIFTNVTELWVHDIDPLKHEFFLRIAQAFPVLESFYVSDYTPLPYIAKKSSDNIQSHRIVEYLHLTSLDIARTTGIDCIEQFLNETRTHLPRLAELRIRYEGLRIVTKDFTREATRRNCVNVT